MSFVVILLILFAMVFFVAGPLRRLGREGPADDSGAPDEGSSEIAELEAAREAKYREIRDAELDHQTGKLSDQDYGELDASLRAEAVQILGALDRASAASGTH